MKSLSLQEVALLFFLFLFSIATGYFGIWGYISDSEFTAITIGGQLGTWPPTEVSVYFKLVFYSFLKIPHLLNLSNTEHIYFSRIMFTTFAFVLYGVAGFYVYRRTGNRELSLYYVLCIMTSLFGLSQLARVRSDLMTTLTFFLILHLVLLPLIKNRTTSERKLGLYCFLISVALILTTPKSVVLYILAWVLLGYYLNKNLGYSFGRILILALLAPAVIFVMGFLTLTVNDFNPVALAYSGALSFFISSFDKGYLSIKDFEYYLYFVKKSPVHSLFIAIGIGFLLFRLKKVSVDILFPVVGAFLFAVLHNHKMPFFLASLLPLLFLFILDIWENQYFQKLKEPLLIGMLFTGAMNVVHLVPRSSNDQQLKLIGQWESFLKEGDYSYYDPVGILPRDRYVGRFVSPSDTEDPWVVDWLTEQRPDFILRLPRFDYLEPALTPFLLRYYSHLGNNVWVKSLALFDIWEWNGFPKSLEGHLIDQAIVRNWGNSSADFFILRGRFDDPVAPTSLSLALKGGKEILIEKWRPGVFQDAVLPIGDEMRWVKISKFPLEKQKFNLDFRKTFTFDRL